MITIHAERPDAPDARALIGELDALLEPLYARESRHGYSVEELLAERVAFFVARRDGEPAGCGGVRVVGREYAELKRMYVRPQFRGEGVGSALLGHLTEHARASGVPLLRLETGIYQREAIRLYERAGFRRIPPFADYTDDLVSRCYEKQLV